MFISHVNASHLPVAAACLGCRCWVLVKSLPVMGQYIVTGVTCTCVGNSISNADRPTRTHIPGYSRRTPVSRWGVIPRDLDSTVVQSQRLHRGTVSTTPQWYSLNDSTVVQSQRLHSGTVSTTPHWYSGTVSTTPQWYSLNDSTVVQSQRLHSGTVSPTPVVQSQPVSQLKLPLLLHNRPRLALWLDPSLPHAGGTTLTRQPSTWHSCLPHIQGSHYQSLLQCYNLPSSPSL